MRFVDYIFEKTQRSARPEYTGGSRPELADFDDSYKYESRDLEIEESDN